MDVADVQLENLRKKVNNFSNVKLHQQDSNAMTFEDGSFDNVILFFLLHEQPEYARQLSIQEAVRVCKPGGKVVFIDYHKPYAYNPFRYVMYPVLKYLEPFALDLWQKDLETWIPEVSSIQKELYFGGLYQKVVITK